MDHSRKSYDKEKMKNADLETQLTTLDQDMKFKIQLLETELQEEKSRNKIDFNAIDRQLKSDYENRCHLLFIVKINICEKSSIYLISSG